MPEPTTPWRRLTGLSRYDRPELITRGPLTAASSTISSRRIKRAHTYGEAWQQEAIELYSEVGELRYLANAQANAASRAELFVAKYEDGGTIPARVFAEDDPIPLAAWDEFGGGPIGRAELVKRLFLQLFITGDGYIVGIPPGVVDDRDPITNRPIALADLTWRVIAPNEITLKQDKLTLNLGDHQRYTLSLDTTVVVRAWRPNPFRYWQADSPVRSNLPVLRELVGLTKHISATIDSRLAGAGLLLMGESFSLLAGQSPDPDDTPEADPVLDALMDAMLTAIRDRDSASAVMPIILTGPDDAIDKVQHLTFSTPFDSATKELRDEAIRRLALGLEAPPEVLLGMGSTTHWNAWIVQDENVKTHIDPALGLICDALTHDYLWPVLEEAGVRDFDSYAIWWDTTPLTLRPDRSREAIELYDRGEITGFALRRETGFTDDDAPEEDRDVAVETALRLVTAAPSLIADPGLPGLVAQIRAVTEGNGAAVEVEVEGPDGPAAPAEPDLPAEGMPDTDGLTDPAMTAATNPPDAPGGGELPEAYRPALSDDVPEGRACGNCAFYDEAFVSPDGEQAWCHWWAAYVRGDHYCDAWQEETEEENLADSDR